VAHAPHLGVVANPWPGSVALYSAAQDAGYEMNRLLSANATFGVTESPLFAARPAMVDRGLPLRVRLSHGELDSVSLTRMLNGANLAAIGDGTPENWEIFQFTTATLVEDGVYDITGRLRGQLGSDAMMPDHWPEGSYFVLLDNAVQQISLNASARGLARHYRVGPSGRGYDDPIYEHRIKAWIRRTRLEGDSWQSTEVPLGESDESYLVRVMQGDTLLREETVSGPSWTYHASAQSADGAGASFSIKVAQLSDRFGPGLFGQLDIGA
ncbi:MAG: host specificity protein, partial [Rhodobacterales bacterium]